MPATYSVWICNFPVEFCKSYREEIGLFRVSDFCNFKAIPVYGKKRYIVIYLTKPLPQDLRGPESERTLQEHGAGDFEADDEGPGHCGCLRPNERERTS